MTNLNSFCHLIKHSNMKKVLSQEDLDNLWKEVSVMSGDEGEKKYKKYCFDESGILVATYPSDQNIIDVKGNEMELDGDFGYLIISGNVRKGAFTGSALNKGVFEFLANHTNVEWAYCYKKDSTGGVLMTSNEEHQTDLLDNPDFYALNGYNCYAHNHSQTEKGYEEKFRQYNSYPSQYDIDQMKQQGFQYAEIYNESDGNYYSFRDGSNVQDEDLAKRIFGKGGFTFE